MASWGSCDYKQLQDLQKRLEKLQKADMQKFCIDASRDLAARLLALVIPRTPVGKSLREKGDDGKMRTVHMGGTLRRGWTAKTEAEAGQRGGGNNGAAYAQTLPVNKSGDSYQITVINPVHYASYVEFGHRTRQKRIDPTTGKKPKRGWVKGQYMLTISEKQLSTLAPALLEKKLQAFLAEVFNG